MTTTDAWPAQWLRGVLDLAVLVVVGRGETYGYRISADLQETGFGVVKGGTLYPLLARLEEAGDVTATWRESPSGPGRKWYSITPAGRRRLDQDGAQWRAFARLTSEMLPDPIASGGTR
ncbi:MAG TPA: PadR family transcriptional regulator [Actinomycetales bacterium]|jgi:PadR family transcriptional regulator PadR